MAAHAVRALVAGVTAVSLVVAGADLGFAYMQRFISVVAGLWLHGRGVSMWSESNFDVDDNWLTRLGQAQQLAFMLGIGLILIFVAIELSNPACQETTRTCGRSRHGGRRTLRHASPGPGTKRVRQLGLGRARASMALRLKPSDLQGNRARACPLVDARPSLVFSW
jgi:hypothetical protein